MNGPKVLLTVAAGLLLAASPASAASPGDRSIGAPAAPAPTLSEQRLIVEWAPGVARPERVRARADAAVESARMLAHPRFQLLDVEPGTSAAAALAELRADPAVEIAQRDGYHRLDAIPNDPLFGQLWGLRNLGTGIGGVGGALAGADANVVPAWDRTVGDPATVAAVIDGGYRFDHPDLGPVAWTNPGEIAANGIDDDANGFVDDTRGYDFVGAIANSPSADNDPTDDDNLGGGHGLHTAGTVGAAGDNGIGITGVARNVRIMPLRVCAPLFAGSTESRCPFSSEVAAINYAGAMGARVANVSLGGTTFNAAVRDALAANPGTLFVISAGNDGQNNDAVPHYPCNFNPLAEGKSAVDNVVCVAATDQADGLAAFSDWGATAVDLGAPGTEVLSTYLGVDAVFHEDFEADDFATSWSASGANGFGRAGAGDGALDSFGMSDSPGGAPAANAEYESTLTTGVAIPAGYGSCKVEGLRSRVPDSGSSYFYEVLSDGASVFKNTAGSATGSQMVHWNTVPITGLGGHSVKLRFGYTAGSAPTAANGFWLDELEISCYKEVGSVGYEFLQGTSMAAPHVTGAASLLFSLKPSATVTEVREALLTSAEPVASLSGKSVTGGRLDTAAALEALVPSPEPTPPAPPAASTGVTFTPPAPGPPASAGNRGPKRLSLRGRPRVGNRVTTLVALVPGAGKLRVTELGKRKRRLLRTLALRVRRGGVLKVRLKPTGLGKRVLNRRGKLRVKVRLSFKPNGSKRTQTLTRSVILRKKGG